MLVAVAVAVLVLAVATFYGVWTARRLDGLHRRVAAAATALDDQLRARAASAGALATAAEVASPLAERTSTAALRTSAVAAGAAAGLGAERERVENVLSQRVADVVAARPHLLAETPEGSSLHDDALRAGIARRFHGDAVRDALLLRDRRVVRWLHLAGSAPHPAYLHMVDPPLPAAMIVASGAPYHDGRE